MTKLHLIRTQLQSAYLMTKPLFTPSLIFAARWVTSACHTIQLHSPQHHVYLYFMLYWTIPSNITKIMPCLHAGSLALWQWRCKHKQRNAELSPVDTEMQIYHLWV